MVIIDEMIGYDYHRNGVCGLGFYVADFLFSDSACNINKMPARAILFINNDEKPTHYAITTEDRHDCWRGDHFIDDLWQQIQSMEKQAEEGEINHAID